ncbi:archease [Fervidobacterium thailandense]|uniref:Archease domain-containing protein n=1 Tax=Fervidobacterium thailandense TaxID=1008305 RepID=A0A1E3G2C8_9BACT|nr:archease [Fervidobacterium thailandense]ODN30280.1 hypothetical protein A4H02_06225 [Fervidobacterium thailandense]
MFKDISHTADLAYEVVCRDGEELLKDVIEIVRTHTEFQEEAVRGKNGAKVQKSKRKCYNKLRNLDNVDEDLLFDIVNEIILIIDTGYFPTKVEGTCVYFESRKAVCRLKALTYHMLTIEKEGDNFRIRMVFDV